MKKTINFVNLFCFIFLLFINIKLGHANNLIVNNPINQSDARSHFLSANDFNLKQITDLNSIVYTGFNLKNWNPTDTLFEGQITCSASKCVSLEEAIEIAIKNGFSTREGLERVFRSRQQILASIGNLLPRIEFNIGYGIQPNGILNTVSNLLGFLLPSNWFSWKESKLFYAAERSSYLGILQDQISNTEVMYYNAHRIMFDLLIYGYYVDHLENLINEIKQKNEVDQKIPHRDILMLENYLAEIRADATTLDGIIKEIDEYNLAIAMAYPDMGGLGINPIKLPDLSKIPEYIKSEKDLIQIKTNSSELLTLRYLKIASKYTRLTRIFSFLGNGDRDDSGRPTIGISFGLDNIANIRVCSSEMRSLEIKIKETEFNTESVYRKAVDSYNASVVLYKQYVAAKEPNRELFLSILNEYNNNGTLAVEPLIKTINWALKFELGRNFVQHFYLTSVSQIDRLLVKGDKYARLTGKVPQNKVLHRWYDRLKIRENKEVDRDIRRGIIDLQNP